MENFGELLCEAATYNGKVQRKVWKGSVPNPSDRLIFVKVQAKDGHFFGQKYEQNSSFCDWWQFGDGWGSVVVQNLPSERKLPMGKVQKKVKKKLTSVSFMYVCVAENAELLVFFYFFFAPSP